MKKQSNFYVKYIVVISLCLLAVGGFFAVKAIGLGSKLDVVGVEKDNPYYSLRKNATEYQKTIYKEIGLEFKKEPIDQSAISGLVVKNYVADFYTWTNKLRFNDVGGLQYLHKDIQGWVSAQALESFYGDLLYYLDNGTAEGTLEVSDVNVQVEPTEYYVEDLDEEEALEEGVQKHVAYRVHATWSYQPSTRLDVSEYQNEAIFTLIADEEGLFSIVEVQNVEAE